MSDFSDRLGAMVAKEMASADADHAAEVIERLLHNAAFAISVTSGGDKAKMETMLTGAENYMAETAIGFADFSRVMALVKARPPGTGEPD